LRAASSSKFGLMISKANTPPWARRPATCARRAARSSLRVRWASELRETSPARSAGRDRRIAYRLRSVPVRRPSPRPLREQREALPGSIQPDHLVAIRCGRDGQASCPAAELQDRSHRSGSHIPVEFLAWTRRDDRVVQRRQIIQRRRLVRRRPIKVALSETPKTRCVNRAGTGANSRRRDGEAGCRPAARAARTGSCAPTDIDTAYRPAGRDISMPKEACGNE
jgi:hypothetical protein